jgi:hypothetical protein
MNSIHEIDQLKLQLNIQKPNLGIEGLSKSKITKELKNISELIVRYNISHRKTKPFQPKYSGIGPIQDEIYHTFEKLIKLIPNEINKCEGIPLVLHANYLDNIPELIIRKCLLFGETTILVLPSIAKSKIKDSLYKYYSIPKVLIDFFTKYSSLIQDGLIIPVPLSAFNKIDKKFNSIEKSGYLAFDKAKVVQYFGHSGELDNLFMLSENHIFFPSLSNIKLKTIRDLREKENYSFRTFHKNLKELKNENSFTNEKALIELIKETDHEVRLIDSKVRNQRKLTYQELLINFGGVASATFLTNSDNELLSTISAAVGGVSSLECIRLLAQNRKVMNDFKLEGFYFPWKLSRKIHH